MRITGRNLRRIIIEKQVLSNTQHKNIKSLKTTAIDLGKKYAEIKNKIAQEKYIAYCDNMYDEQIATSTANDIRVKFPIRKDVWLKANHDLLEDLFREKSLEDAKNTVNAIVAYDLHEKAVDEYEAAVQAEKTTQHQSSSTEKEKYVADIQKILGVDDDGDWGQLTNDAWGAWLDSNASKMSFHPGITIEDLKANWKANSQWVIRVNGITVSPYSGTPAGMLRLINAVNDGKTVSESRWLRLAGLLKS